MANEKYLANTLYNVTTGAFYHEVGLPGDTDTGDDVVTGDPVAAAKVVVGDQTAIADLAPISGGEAPTEAEHNLVVAKVNAIIAALEAAGLLTVTP